MCEHYTNNEPRRTLGINHEGKSCADMNFVDARHPRDSSGYDRTSFVRPRLSAPKTAVLNSSSFFFSSSFSSLAISFYRCFLPRSFETFRMRSDYCQYTGCCILESSNSKGLAKREECYGKFVDKRCVTELQRSNRTYEVDDDRFFITAHESRPCYGVGVVTRLFITW